MKYKRFKSIKWETLLHIVIGGYVIASPLLYPSPSMSEWSFNDFLRTLFPVFSVCFIFYLNYFSLIPQYMMKRRHALFWGINVTIAILFCMMHEVVFTLTQNAHNIMPPHPPGGKIEPQMKSWDSVKIIFALRNLFVYIVVVFISIAGALSVKWKAAEIAKNNAILAMKEAELKILKNQINPHFLLNTLNNIYALTDIDKEKARDAIVQLSKLLRYMLYENQENFIPLSKEVDIIHTYIKLMRLRVAESIVVDYDFIKLTEGDAKIAPFMFMSLTENAFKHGIYHPRKSFVKICLIQSSSHVIFNCINSCKNQEMQDKIDNGLGLKQVAAQLEYFYPNKYKWIKGYNPKTSHYVSRIEIKL